MQTARPVMGAKCRGYMRNSKWAGSPWGDHIRIQRGTHPGRKLPWEERKLRKWKSRTVLWAFCYQTHHIGSGM